MSWVPLLTSRIYSLERQTRVNPESVNVRIGFNPDSYPLLTLNPFRVNPRGNPMHAYMHACRVRGLG